MDIQHSTWNKQESGSSGLGQKQQHSGTDVAPNGLPCSGQLIDYARSLKFDQLPDLSAAAFANTKNSCTSWLTGPCHDRVEYSS